MALAGVDAAGLVATARLVIQQVGGVDAGAATRLAERLGRCATEADVTRLVAEGRALLKRLGEAIPAGIKYFSATVPTEISRMIADIRGAIDLKTLQGKRGEMVLTMQGFLEEKSA